MEKIFKYPGRYEIEQALGELGSRRFLDNFAQERGVFITKVNQPELAEIMSGLFFENSDIEEIRKAALRIHVKTTLAGFYVHNTEDDFDLIAHIDNLRQNDSAGRDNKIEELVKLEDDEDGELYRGTLIHTERKPGRVEFLQEQRRNIDFYIKKTNEGQWKFLVDCNKSADARILEDLVDNSTSKETRLAKLNQDLLTSDQTVKFFDELATKGMDSNWEFKEVRQLVFRKPKDRNDDEELEAEESALAGITQAILDGHDLRENPFVKRSEQSGYRFTAMTFEYDHITKPFNILIHSEFKEKPKVFEIGITSFKSREGVDEKLVPYSLPEEEEKEIRFAFWARSKEIFDKLIA